MTKYLELPHNEQAEQALLGAILIKPESIFAALGMSPEDFYLSEHAQVFRAMKALYSSSRPIDPVSLAGQGIDVALTSRLTDSNFTAENIDYYVRAVRKSATQRRVLIAAEEIQRAAAEGEEPDAVISSGISKLQACFDAKSEFHHISDYANDWLKSATDRYENPDQAKPLGVATGITKLNETLAYTGLPRGHLTVVGAESSRGKSALLDNGFALPAALYGHRVCICSLEDSGKSLFVRHLSSLTKIQNRQLQQEIVGRSEWTDVKQSTMQISDLNIWILDVVPSGVDAMVGQIKRHLQKHPADLLGIDYLQFISAGVKTEGKTAASEYVITAIAKLARELPDTATVLLSQYRKIKDEAKPTDDDLRDANAVRYYAHSIIHIWCPRRADGLDCRTLIVSKNKNGPIGDITAGWIPRTVTFCDPTPSDQAKYEELLGVNK